MIINRSSLYTLSINTLVFLFGALMLTLKSGYSYAPIALVLLALPLLFKKQTYQFADKQKSFIFTLVLYILILLISHIRESGLDGHDLEPPLRITAAIIVFLLLYQSRLLFSAIIYGFLVGALIAFGLAVYEKLILGSARAFSFINRSYVIQAGDISMSLGLICLTIAIYFYRIKDWPKTSLFIFGTFAGIIASLLSGTRGGWVFFPIILFALYGLYRHLLSKKAKWGSVILLIILGVLCTIPQFGVTTRIQQAVNDISLYTNGENKNTSLGTRFQLWHSAWLSFKERPIFGWGDETLAVSKQAHVESGVISQYIYQARYHAHNEFLDEMAKRGLIGLFALIALFAVPFWLFKKAFAKTENFQVQTMASTGMIIILSTIDYCMSQAFLKHNSGVMFYFISIAILMAFCYPKKHTAP